MARSLLTILFFMALGLMTGCGSKVSGWVGSDCYECEGVNTPCDCSGYGGYNNPKALNLFRPGRLEDLDSPVW